MVDAPPLQLFQRAPKRVVGLVRQPILHRQIETYLAPRPVHCAGGRQEARLSALIIRPSAECIGHPCWIVQTMFGLVWHVIARRNARSHGQQDLPAAKHQCATLIRCAHARLVELAHGFHRCGVQLVEQRVCKRIGWGLFVGHAAKVGADSLTVRALTPFENRAGR